MKAVASATMGAFDTFVNGKERVEGRRGLNEIRDPQDLETARWIGTFTVGL